MYNIRICNFIDLNINGSHISGDDMWVVQTIKAIRIPCGVMYIDILINVV